MVFNLKSGIFCLDWLSTCDNDKLRNFGIFDADTDMLYWMVWDAGRKELSILQFQSFD